MNIEEKIISKIKEENLKPKSIWYFLARDYSLWSMVFLSVLLAAFSIAPIIFILQNLELGYTKHITNNAFLFILDILPYPWIILCVLTTYLAIKAWEKTSNGYKFEGKYIFIYSFLTSLILGVMLNFWNFGKMMDEEIVTASFGKYKNFQERRDMAWFNPEAGRIFGTVESISTSSFMLSNEKKSFKQEVYYDFSVIGSDNIFEQNNVRVVGFNKDMKDNTESFVACIVFPDDFRPSKKDKKEFEKKNLLMDKSSIHEECKEIFEQGRAFFHPKPERK